MISRRYFKTTAPIVNPYYKGRRRGIEAYEVFPVGTQILATTYTGGIVEYQITGIHNGHVVSKMVNEIAAQDTGDRNPPASFEQLAERNFASADWLARRVLEKLIEEGRVRLDEIEANYL